jgi:hypothetical protein
VVLDIVNKEIPVFFFLLINLKYDLSWECISYLCLLLFLICRWKFRVHTTGLINIFLECIIISDFNSKIHSKQQGNWSELYISSKSKKIIRYCYFYFFLISHFYFWNLYQPVLIILKCPYLLPWYLPNYLILLKYFLRVLVY